MNNKNDQQQTQHINNNKNNIKTKGTTNRTQRQTNK